eukprot:2048843-Prorocentrum_lima.AAC.1
MTSSLVGSEMCIRDSQTATQEMQALWMETRTMVEPGQHPAMPVPPFSVSYTHLTLPTICSV